MELDARDRPADTGPVFLLALKVASRFRCLKDGSSLLRRWGCVEKDFEFASGLSGEEGCSCQGNLHFILQTGILLRMKGTVLELQLNSTFNPGLSYVNQDVWSPKGVTLCVIRIPGCRTR